MNRAQKIAVFNLVVFGTASLLAAVAMVILYHLYGWPKAADGLGFLGIGGITGFSRLIFKKDAGAVIFDERDKLIHRTAALAGFVCSNVWFSIALVAPVVIYGSTARIEARWPLLFFIIGAILITETVRSITLLVLYGRSDKNE